MGQRPGCKKPLGSGRRKGSLTKKTQAIAKDMIASGALTPLEVMMKAMLVHVNAKRWDQAAAIAKDAAPYIHPRLALMQANIRHRFEDMNDAELDAAIAQHFPVDAAGEDRFTGPSH